jgi:hypothetical protein
MATVNPKTFPGVYTSITDDSFVQPAASRFRPGLIGVATKGPFNTPTSVRSLKEFRELFGEPLTTTYQNDGTERGRLLPGRRRGDDLRHDGRDRRGARRQPVRRTSSPGRVRLSGTLISARANTTCSPRPRITRSTSRSPKAASRAQLALASSRSATAPCRY